MPRVQRRRGKRTACGLRVGPIFHPTRRSSAVSRGAAPRTPPAPAQTPVTGANQPALPQSESAAPGVPAPSSTNPSSDVGAANPPARSADWAKLSRADIRQIQEKLHSEGIYRGRIDGLNGPVTQQALRTYQRKNGLPVTGTPDPQTLSSLQISMTGVGSSTAPGSSEMNPSGAGTSSIK